MNILVIKTGALGDVVRTSFIAQALKDKYANILKHTYPKIFWLTDKNAAPFFINNDYVNKVVTLEKKHTLKSVKWDLIINLEEDEENCNFVKALNPKEIKGFVYKNNKSHHTPTTKEWFNMSMVGPKPQNDILKKNNKKTHRQLISEIVEVKEYKKYEPFLRLTQKQRNFANDFLRRYNLKQTDQIIGINTGSADRWPKQLSTKKTAQLIDKLHKKFKAKIILFGGPSEFQRNQEIQKISKSPIIDTGTGNDLLEFPALISVCNLLITSDSLGLHVSLALKRNTIVFIGPTSPTEIDMYGFGEKVVINRDCVACYRNYKKTCKKYCKGIESITIDEIINKAEKLMSKKIIVLITAYKEPLISKAIESALNQKTNYDYEVILSAPDKETLEIAKEYTKYKNFKTTVDPGKGKSYALNLAFKKLDTDILILTDGDTYLGEDVVEEITNLFLNPEIGCVSGRPIPQESKKTKFGYWANFLFDSAHKIRKKSFATNSFIECSGYLFAFRKKRIKKIPLDVAEDTVIPYIFWQKGYKIGYAENAKVYVKNANNWNDWVKQKIRTHKSHSKLGLYVDTDTNPKVKTFKNEAKGISWLLQYPQDIKEAIWTQELALSRFYTWIKYYLDTLFLDRQYSDGWERIESTK